MEGGGGVVTFDITGGKQAAFKLANALSLIDISNNLGDTKIAFDSSRNHYPPKAGARGTRGTGNQSGNFENFGGAGRR